MNGTENNYQTFQGKLHQKELDLNWHDFHSRQYMSDIGRTTILDPLAEDFYGISPYSFLNNSPPNFIDPTGMSAESPDHEYKFVWNEETEQYDQE